MMAEKDQDYKDLKLIFFIEIDNKPMFCECQLIHIKI